MQWEPFVRISIFESPSLCRKVSSYTLILPFGLISSNHLVATHLPIFLCLVLRLSTWNFYIFHWCRFFICVIWINSRLYFECTNVDNSKLNGYFLSWNQLFLISMCQFHCKIIAKGLLFMTLISLIIGLEDLGKFKKLQNILMKFSLNYQ